MQPQEAIVYTETVVHAPPLRYASEAPYQLAIVTFADGSRQTVRIAGANPEDRVAIGDRVRLVEERAGIHFYARIQART